MDTKTGDTKTGGTNTGFTEERAELEAVLASGIFGRSPTLAQFLQFVCNRYFEGHADSIKEYNVAVEALGRPSDFDQKRDSIVRVEAHRLRKRLQAYYSAEGASHAIQISLPAGSYVPHFNSRNGNVEPEAADHHPIDVVQTQIPGTPAKPRRAFLLSGAAGLLATVGGTGVYAWRRLMASPEPPAMPVVDTASSLPAIAAGSDTFRIIAGSNSARFVDRWGNVWQGDKWYRGGDALSVAPRPIVRATDPTIFLNRREGNFDYDIPLKAGVYELRLYFAETIFGDTNLAGGGETSRVFNVAANGALLLEQFDIVSDAAGANIADIKVFKDIQPAPDGSLHLSFATHSQGRAFVNAIEILPATAGKMAPVRLAAQEGNLTDSASVIWSADRYFTGGQRIQRYDAVLGTADQDIYRGERFGNFTYVIPVAERSRYSVRLRFCETWFGDKRPGGGGAGSRIFDVCCNGRALLRNFDIHKEAGPLRALDKVFHGVEPNAQGKLILSFVPVRNYALVNAIEVGDEGRA